MPKNKKAAARVSSSPDKSLRTKGGLEILLSDKKNQQAIFIKTPAGQTITLKNEPGEIEIADSNGNQILIDTAGIRILSQAKVAVQANEVEINAAAVTVNAGISKFSGVVQCDTLQANSVISASYTPGSGNIW